MIECQVRCYENTRPAWLHCSIFQLVTLIVHGIRAKEIVALTQLFALYRSVGYLLINILAISSRVVSFSTLLAAYQVHSFEHAIPNPILALFVAYSGAQISGEITGSLSPLRTLLPKSSSRPLPAYWPNHAT